MTDGSRATADLLNGFPDIDPDINILPNHNANYFDEVSFNSLPSTHPKIFEQFCLLFLNIRSAVKNLHSLDAYLYNINVKFSIIGLAETWFKDDIEQLYGLSDYKRVSLSRPGAKRGGGVALYIHKYLSYKPRNDLSNISENAECFFIEINNSPFNKFKPLIGVIYRPPNTDPIHFLDTMSSLLDKLKSEKKNLLHHGWLQFQLA